MVWEVGGVGSIRGNGMYGVPDRGLCTGGGGGLSVFFVFLFFCFLCVWYMVILYMHIV